MRRAILLLAAFLALCVMPWAASLHSTQMALAQAAASHDAAPAGGSHHAAHGADTSTVALDCGSQQPCSLAASLCGWVCASGHAAQPAHLLASPGAWPRARLAPTDDLLFKGIVPPLNERPPTASLRRL